MLEKFTYINSDFYINRYLKFIDNYKDYPNIKSFTDKHHILPTSIYPEYSKEEWNIINLPYRVHYIAHYMLAKAIGGKMWHAFNMMNKRGASSKLFEVGKINHIKEIKNDKDRTVKWRNTKSLKDENGLNGFDRGKIKLKESYLLNKEKVYNAAQKQSETKNKIQYNGLTISQEAGLKASKTMRNKPFVTCPHCNLYARNSSNMTRYHFNNCKEKD